jgi:HPt (histidine-containing phosphotransfer) domain-containing protein
MDLDDIRYVPFTHFSWWDGLDRAGRYLDRTMKRLQELEAMIHSLDTPGVLEELRVHVHKIAGSAGLYGFPAASKTAGHMEVLLVSLIEAAKPVEASVRADLLAGIRQIRQDMVERRKTQGKRRIFVSFSRQMAVILPVAAASGLSLFIGFLAVAWIRVRVLEDFRAEQVRGEAVQSVGAFLQAATWSYAGLSVLILGVTVYWAWRVSLWVFGPVPRLERELDAAIQDPQSLVQWQVRQSDALYPLLRRVERLIRKFRARSSAGPASG